ncbi:MAG: M12 family metallo-peptidase [Marinicella sp.]
MKLLISLVIIGLSLFVPTQTLALNSATETPEAYTGLNPSAYHRLELNHSKANQISFQLKGKTIPIDVSQNKTSTSAASNISFTQSIPNGSISATQGENSLFGQMHLNNKHYILTTNQAGIWAVELPSTGVTYNDCGLDHEHSITEALKNIGSLPNADKSNDISTQDNTDTANSANIAPGTIIDVLVIYDQAIADRYPGSLLQARVDQYFNVSNQTYANSALDLGIRQVGLEQVGYNFNDANINARNAIQSSLSFGIGAQGFENVPLLRTETGADLVIFLRTHNIETRGNCGIAFFPVFNNSSGQFDSSYGVNIMADGMSSWSICTDQLMVHEIGHNLSAGHHNWDPTEFGFPVEAKGFAKLGQYGTVMGSFGTGTPDRFLELDYFSNPAVQCGGGPCGITNQRDNAKIINQLMGPVSNYIPSSSTTPNPPDLTVALIDQDGDGVLDRDDEFPYDSSETTDTDGDGAGDNEDAFPTNASESSDFDGDGIGDNADFDDDDDGILDFDDDFPLDNTEVKDSDRDGIGDNTDAFIFEASEYKDHDNDLVGNDADNDDDNDGIIDISTDKQDLLVISVGNNRILRFDAQTGLAKGIEVLPEDGLLTFQSDLAYDSERQLLYYITQSSVRKLDLMNRESHSELSIPAYSENRTSLNTGFPTALIADDGYALYVALLRGNFLRNYRTQNRQEPSFFFDTYFPSNIPDGEFENIIDIEKHHDEVFTLGQYNRVYRGNINGSNLTQIGNSNMSWLVDPYAFVVTDDDMLIHTDQSRNKLVMTDGNAGTFEGIFADIAELGYSNPTGIDITNDGRLLVAVADQNAILEFDLTSQAFLGELTSGFGLDQPHKMVLVPQLDDRFNEDADKVIRPNAGSWYNPVTTGRGFNIGIFGNRIQVLWYTYDEQGLPIWYFSADFLNGMSYDTDLLKTTQVDDTTVTFENIGRLAIDFDNERQATVNWQIGPDSGEESIQWLQFSGEPETENYTGLWSRPDTPGWGLAVTTIGEKSITIPFIYDGDGEPRWVISNVADGIQPLNFDMVTIFSDNLCPTCSGPADPVQVPSGTMTLNLGDDANWSSAVLWADPVPGTWNLEQTELVRISSPPTRPR